MARGTATPTFVLRTLLQAYFLFARMDVSKLEEELMASVHADDLYWLRNDAKLRAAKQTSSYEEFDQIVKVGAGQSEWRRLSFHGQAYVFMKERGKNRKNLFEKMQSKLAFKPILFYLVVL